MKRKATLAISIPAALVLAGLASVSGSGIQAVRAGHASTVVDWNLTMLSTLAAAKVPPPPASRDGAIIQAAVFDAVNGIEPHYSAIHVAPAAPRGASRDAAAASAAYTALVSLFPAQRSSLDAALRS